MAPQAHTPQGCSEFRQSLRHSRRDFVKAGMLGTAGLTLTDLLRTEACAAANNEAQTRQPSVIILWMRGGPSHIDMWDPKPDAPVEYRGEFGTANTNVTGIQLGDRSEE